MYIYFLKPVTQNVYTFMHVKKCSLRRMDINFQLNQIALNGLETTVSLQNDLSSLYWIVDHASKDPASLRRIHTHLH